MPDRGWPPEGWTHKGKGNGFDLAEFLQRLGGRDGPPTPGPALIWSALAAVAVLVVVASSWFTVQPEETALVLRFGRVVRTAGPGLHFKWPYGVEQVINVPTARVLKEEFGFRTISSDQQSTYSSHGYTDESLMLTGDLNVIDVQWIVQYRIEDPFQFLFKVRDTPRTVRDISESVMRRVVGNRLGSDVLTVGRVEISRMVRDEMQRILEEYGAGVRLVTVELQDVTPPDPVKPAFNEVNEARQDRERTINQAQEQANREIPKARGEAERMVTEAEGGAVERVNRARGEAERFNAIYKEYQAVPDVTRRRLYLEAMTAILPEVKEIFVVDESQKAMLPFLSLGGQGAATPAGVQP
jgi:membrane protease subunit HflK